MLLKSSQTVKNFELYILKAFSFVFHEDHVISRTETWYFGNIMAVFDGHLKCARCRDKGVGKDLCVQKKNCPLCKAFTAEQKQKLAPLPTGHEKRRNTVRRLLLLPTL